MIKQCSYYFVGMFISFRSLNIFLFLIRIRNRDLPDYDSRRATSDKTPQISLPISIFCFSWDSNLLRGTNINQKEYGLLF